MMKQFVDFDNVPARHVTLVHVPFQHSEKHVGAMQLIERLYRLKLLDVMSVRLGPPFTECSNAQKAEVPGVLRIDIESHTLAPDGRLETLRELWGVLLSYGLEVTWKHGETGYQIIGECEVKKTWSLCDDMT